jgi:hypothetical protein
VKWAFPKCTVATFGPRVYPGAATVSVTYHFSAPSGGALDLPEIIHLVKGSEGRWLGSRLSDVTTSLARFSRTTLSSLGDERAPAGVRSVGGQRQGASLPGPRARYAGTRLEVRAGWARPTVSSVARRSDTHARPVPFYPDMNGVCRDLGPL